jgi:hypothetical protein
MILCRFHIVQGSIIPIMNIFPKHTLFSTIYLLQKEILNHRNYFEQEINMINFVQATENDVHMYAKFGYLTFYAFLVDNYFNV